MVIDAERASFMESPVMIIVGTCDDALRPQVARAMGAVVATEMIFVQTPGDKAGERLAPSL